MTKKAKSFVLPNGKKLTKKTIRELNKIAKQIKKEQDKPPASAFRYEY